MGRAVIVFALAIVGFALSDIGVVAQGWCNVSVSNHTVDLGLLAPVNLTASLIADDKVLNVTLGTGFCTGQVSSVCGTDAVVSISEGGKCVDSFEAITGPAFAYNSDVFVKAWSTSTTAVAVLKFTCNPAVPIGHAVLAGPIIRSTIAEYDINFNTAAVCV